MTNFWSDFIESRSPEKNKKYSNVDDDDVDQTKKTTTTHTNPYKRYQTQTNLVFFESRVLPQKTSFGQKKVTTPPMMP